MGPSIGSVEDALASGLEPSWEHPYPGNLKYELLQLQESALVHGIDMDALHDGQLVVFFSWELERGERVELVAIYTDAFPFAAPIVRYLSGLPKPPNRHVNPNNGTVCLLGRDTRQWQADWTLKDLLSAQLQDALYGTGDEDPQGEPADVWWNSLGAQHACALVDSSWDLPENGEGTLFLRHVVVGVQEQDGERGRIPILRGFIEEVCDRDGGTLHTWNSVVPREFANAKDVFKIPWVKLSEPLMPWEDLNKIAEVLQAGNSRLKRTRSIRVAHGIDVELFAVAHSVEISQSETGLGWVILQLASEKAGNHPKGQISVTASTIPVYRAGQEDLGLRVPAVGVLNDKRVLVVGIGAIGAPLAIDLARNGCHSLHLIEHDVVEPGNTVRWPVGASAWGRPKAEVIKQFIENEYPGTVVQAYRHFIGVDPNDGGILDPILENASLVIDASTSFSVTRYLADLCRRRNLPLITLGATATLEGGVVVLHTPSGGCPTCLEYSYTEDKIDRPPGDGKESALTQPSGCAERTFSGADYDLLELSLQSMRLAVETLKNDALDESIVLTLSFVDDKGNRTPPAWTLKKLPKHPKCNCHLAPR